MRRRMQTGQAAYPSVFRGLVEIAQKEGVRRGLFRGLSLNYAKVGAAALPWAAPLLARPANAGSPRPRADAAKRSHHDDCLRHDEELNSGGRPRRLRRDMLE